MGVRDLPRVLGYHVDRKTMVVRPDGKRSCRFCKSAVPKGRRNYCGPVCIAAWLWLTDEAHMRATVYKRDRGVCAACGLDTNAVDVQAATAAYVLTARARALRARGAWKAWKTRPPTDPAGDLYPVEFLAAALAHAVAWCVANGVSPERSPWEMDHVVRLADGGPHTLVNCQTLCTPCHREKSAHENRNRSRTAGRGTA